MEDKQGLDQLNREVLQQDLCSACGACLNGCPYLTRFKGKTIILDHCALERARCFIYCPMTFFDREAVSLSVFGSPNQAEGIGRFLDVKASKAGDRRIASAGQGGGTVTALMISALESGMIDAVILTACGPEEDFPGGFIAETADQVLSCAGSRYIGAHSLASLQSALDRGYQHIGVVGLPCQIRAVRKMTLYDLKNENLKERIRVVVGLFCNWAFRIRDFDAFLALRYDLNRVRRMDIPPPPANVLEIETYDHAESIPLDELKSMIQPACSRCPDMTSEFADLSVGMFEGRPGWNTLVLRTPVGMDLLEKAVQGNYIETDNFPESNLSHLKDAAQNKRNRAPNKKAGE